MKGLMGFVFIIIGLALLGGSCNCGGPSYHMVGGRRVAIHRPWFGGYRSRPVARVGFFGGGSRRSSFGGSSRSFGSFGK